MTDGLTSVSTNPPTSMWQMVTRIDRDGTVRVSLDQVPVPTPGPNEVLVRMEAAPINPSDLAIVFAGSNVANAARDVTVPLGLVLPPSERSTSALAGRVATPGTEGVGTVVAAGESARAQALVGSTVAVIGSGTFAEYAVIHWGQCLEVPTGVPVTAAAGAFVNPLTALGMVETMRLEGHSALVHTAAASTLGQMLVRLCAADGIPLVNVVRRAAHVELLRSLGATHVVDSSSSTFAADLVHAIASTGATIAFDAIGGAMSGTLLRSMEAALTDQPAGLDPYGSPTLKQVYVYGLLDDGPISVPREVGMAWAAGGWLLGPFLQRIGLHRVLELRRRVMDEITTTFASQYTDELPLLDAVSPAAAQSYGQPVTGRKFLLRLSAERSDHPKEHP